jgi:hypothetical protein
LKVLLMQRFQTAAAVLTHRLPISENLKVLLMEVYYGKAHYSVAAER